MKSLLPLSALLLLMLCNCFQEENPVENCQKWTLEINNPEATVGITEGRLVIDILNPKTEKDVRLIQYQNPDHMSGEVGAWIQISAFDFEGAIGGSVDTHIRSSFAYATQPDDLIISLVTGGYGKRGYYLGEEIYYDARGTNNNFHAEAESVQFEVDHAINSIQSIPTISATPKIYYLDFGVNPFWTRSNPTASIHVEIDLIAFGNYVDRPMIPLDGFESEKLGFKIDEFDCQSF